jgi:tetratricopeptide (TPR) repeat protein
MGVQYGDLGEFDEGLRLLKRSLSMNPMNSVTYHHIGVIYQSLGDDARAVEWFNKALALKPDLAQTQVSLADMYMEQAKYEQVIEQTTKILSSDPVDVECLRLIGNAELMLGNYSHAEECFARSIAIDSLYGNTTGLGYVYWKTGRQNEARKLFARSLKHDEKELEQGNEDSGVPYDIAEIYAIQGNKAEAYKWLQKAIDAGWRGYRWAATDPLLENLRNDDKFKRMMADVKAMVDKMRKRVEETEKE